MRVSLVTWLRDERSGLPILAGERDFLFPEPSRLALVSIQPHIQWAPLFIPVVVVLRRPGDKEIDHVLRSSGVVKNEWSYTSPPPIRLHGVNRDRF